MSKLPQSKLLQVSCQLTLVAAIDIEAAAYCSILRISEIPLLEQTYLFILYLRTFPFEVSKIDFHVKFIIFSVAILTIRSFVLFVFLFPIFYFLSYNYVRAAIFLATYVNGRMQTTMCLMHRTTNNIVIANCFVFFPECTWISLSDRECSRKIKQIAIKTEWRY